MFNSLVLCIFSNVSPETVIGLINAACGYHWTIRDMLLAGERGWNLKRMINHRLGLTRSNDRLPKAMLTPYNDLLPHDQYAPVIDEMLQAYYEPRGWDPVTGIPTLQKLTELNLAWTVQELLEQK